MHKIAIGIVVLVTALMAGCNDGQQTEGQRVKVNTVGDTVYFNAHHDIAVKVVCLRGVKYWTGHYRLTPYVSKETLTFERCDG